MGKRKGGLDVRIFNQCSSLVRMTGNFKRSNPPGATVRIYTISCILTEAYMWISSSISGKFFLSSGNQRKWISEVALILSSDQTNPKNHSTSAAVKCSAPVVIHLQWMLGKNL